MMLLLWLLILLLHSAHMRISCSCFSTQSSSIAANFLNSSAFQQKFRGKREFISSSLLISGFKNFGFCKPLFASEKSNSEGGFDGFLQGWNTIPAGAQHIYDNPSRENACPIKWPKNQYIRIKLAANNKEDMNAAIKSIFEAAEISSSKIKIVGPIYLPTKKRRFTFQRSPFVDKDSREVFQLTIHTRLLDIYPAVAGKQDGKEQDVDWNRTITKFFSVKLPLTVNWIARFESIEKPSKTKDILAEYTGKWTSRYFQNQWNLEKKVSIVTELLSEKHKPDLLFDWPKCFHDLLKFTIPQLSKMLERVRINFEEREERRLRGLPPFRPKAEIFGL